MYGPEHEHNMGPLTHDNTKCIYDCNFLVRCLVSTLGQKTVWYKRF